MTRLWSTGLVMLVALWAVVAGLPAADGPAATSRLDVTYKQAAAGPLKLDLHYPSAPHAGGRFPLVLFTHGGGWTTSSKTIGTQGVRFRGVSALNAAGYCVASVDYRLCDAAGSITIRDCITDAKDALRFLALHAAEFQLDARRVCTFGDSAGGHLAQLVLLSPPDAFPGDPALAGAEYTLLAGVSWYGPCDFERTELFAAAGETDVRDRFTRRILGAAVDPQRRLAAYREVSPVNYLRADSPPLLMIQGDQDATIPVHHARYMQERATAVQAPVEVLIVENAGHNWRSAGGALHPSLDDVIAATTAFLNRHLPKSSPQ